MTMVDADAFLQMGRDVMASQPVSVLLGEEKLCAIAQGTITKLADKNGTNP